MFHPRYGPIPGSHAMVPRHGLTPGSHPVAPPQGPRQRIHVGMDVMYEIVHQAIYRFFAIDEMYKLVMDEMYEIISI